MLKLDNCQGCNTSFSEIKYHAKNMCCNCYYQSRRVEKKELDHCSKCLCKWGSQSQKNKVVKKGPKGMCRICYQRHYAKMSTTVCRRCGSDMGRKSKSVCSLCKIELESIKAPSKRTLPNVDKVTIDRETREKMRKVFNRYKWGLNTLVDPFIVTDLYLTVFSSEVTKGQTASKADFNLDQFDQENQVIAMLKLLKKAYDII